MYDVHSKHADDFISHEEILETLAYADENKTNEALIDSILEKARLRKGLSGNLPAGGTDQKGFLRKPDRHVCASLPFQLLCERLYLLPVPSEKQTYCTKTADSGRDPERSHRTAGYGT